MKTIAIWLGALVFGFIGGIAGQRFGHLQTMSTELTSSSRAHRFELLDPSGHVVSVWTTDGSGRPFMGFSDGKWEGRVVVGSIDDSDVITNNPPDPNTPWGIRVAAPSHAAYATLGTGMEPNTKKPVGFASWR